MYMYIYYIYIYLYTCLSFVWKRDKIDTCACDDCQQQHPHIFNFVPQKLTLE